MGSRTFKGQRERDQEQRGGTNHPQPTLPPSRHCHSDPNRQIEPSRKTPFGQLNTKNASCSGHKAHTPAFEWRDRWDAGEGCAERWLHRSHSSPAPAPTQRQQLQFSLRLPRRQKLKTRFHWSTAWISWIPLLSTFSAFPGVNTVKRGRKGMGGGHIQGNNCMPPLRSRLSEKMLQRHLQQGSNMRKDYSWSEENKYMLNIFFWRKESNRQRPRNSNIMRYD